MDKTLVIFEFEDEVDSFISQRSINELKDDNVYVLALMPETQAYLKQLNINFFNTGNLFGKEGHEQALLQSDKIYNFCEPFFQIEDELGIKDGYRISLLFYTRLIVHYILWLIEIIENACVRWDIKKIVSCCRDNRHIIEPFLSAKEGYASDVCTKIAKRFNIDCELFNGQKITQNLSLRKLRKFIKEVAVYVVYKIKIIFFVLLLKNKKVVLATSRSYNLGNVLDKLEEAFNNICVIYLSCGKRTYLSKLISSIYCEVVQLPSIVFPGKGRRFYKYLCSIISNLEASQGSKEIFSYRGITFRCLVVKRIREDIVPAICEIYFRCGYLDKFLKKCKPAMIISQMARDTDYNLGELAAKYKIPSLLISHGSHIPPENEYEMIEWKEHGLGLINTHYQYVAIQSPWVKAYLDKIPTRSISINTGPLLFARIDSDDNKKKQLRKKLVPGCEDKIILVYADTPRLRESLRFYVYQTVDEYINSLNSLIKILENRREFYLIVRLRPKHYLSKDDLKMLLIDSDCYSIHTEGGFEDYLSIADMLISYSSTTIEEALQNKVPVLLYDPEGKYCHIKDAQMIGSLSNNEIGSCYFVNNEENLIKTLEYFKVNRAKKIPDLRWDSHVFGESEKVNLASYFNEIFVPNN